MPTPEFRYSSTIHLAGTMAIYNSQAEATEKIPAQWSAFLSQPWPEFHTPASIIGASPCSDDGKLHYLCGIEVPSPDSANPPDRLTLEAGEYDVFTVDDIANLRDTWIWAMTKWLPASGRKERNAPEFEKYLSGTTASGPIEIWIPLEPFAAFA